METFAETITENPLPIFEHIEPEEIAMVEALNLEHGGVGIELTAILYYSNSAWNDKNYFKHRKREYVKRTGLMMYWENRRKMGEEYLLDLIELVRTIESRYKDSFFKQDN